ncbi:MAG: hypothetical protein V1664_04405 [Candidatus Uhrbacteria bacterium]
MSKTPNYDTAIKKILDATQPGERTCVLTGEKWQMTEEEIGWYKKFNVPPLKISPLTHLKKLSAFFTNYQWWWHKNPETGKPVLSGYNPNSGIKVLPDSEWFAKDFSSIQLEPKFDQPFFPQFRQLQTTVPVNASRNLKEPENSLALTSFGDKDSYFVMACASINSFFGLNSKTENSALCIYADSVNDSYDVLHSSRIHNCKTIRESRDCLNSAFLFDCRGCENCFGATNKRNKKYLFFNQQLTKEDWEKTVGTIDLGKRSIFLEYKNKFQQLLKTEAVWPENFNENTVNATGEYITEATNIVDGFFVEKNCSNIYKCFVTPMGSTDSCFSGGVVGGNNCFACLTISFSSSCLFSSVLVRCQNCEYSFHCFNCENCFGCVGLQHKKFCILNRQYSEEEYWIELDKIKSAMLERGEYGNFFPNSYAGSYFYESAAPNTFGCTPGEAKLFGVAEYDPNANGASGFSVFDPATGRTIEQIPESIDDFDTDHWANKPIFDPKINRQFSFLKPEIEFYKRLRIAPPNEHFISRLLTLQKETNSPIFVDFSCIHCGRAIRAAKNFTYQNKKVACHECYLKYLEKNN